MGRPQDIGMFRSNPCPSVSEPGAVLHSGPAYAIWGHILEHTGVFREIWEQLLKHYLYVRGNPDIRP